MNRGLPRTTAENNASQAIEVKKTRAVVMVIIKFATLVPIPMSTSNKKLNSNIMPKKITQPHVILGDWNQNGRYVLRLNAKR